VRLFLLLIAFLGCTAPQGRESFVLKIALWGPLGDLVPTGGNESALASVAQPLVFEKLFTIDTAGELKPGLASRIERLPGGQLRAQLRNDASFSDGTPVSEEDVIRSLESGGLRATHSQGGLLIESRQPGLPADALILEARIFRGSDRKVVGSGPFAVSSQTDSELRLVRRTSIAARINEVRLIAYGTPRDAFAHTLKGDANFLMDLEPRSVEFFKGVPNLQIIHGTGRSTDSIIFKTGIPRQERLRLATVLASQRVRDLAYEGAECSESRANSGDVTDVPEGPTLRVLSWGPFERLALAARRSLADRGGEVSYVAPQETVARLKIHDFDLVTARPLMWPPSTMALIWRTGAPNNFVGYSSAAVDRAIDAGDWRAADLALKEDPPAAFVCTHDHLAVVDSRVKNAMLGPYDILETVPEWEVQ
jgi:hypothetical protein